MKQKFTQTPKQLNEITKIIFIMGSKRCISIVSHATITTLHFSHIVHRSLSLYLFFILIQIVKVNCCNVLKTIIYLAKSIENKKK